MSSLLTRLKKPWLLYTCQIVTASLTNSSRFSKTPHRNLYRSLRTRQTHRHTRIGSGNVSQTTQILLDKFVKHTQIKSSIAAKVSFHLKVRGSFFDDTNCVDRERNRRMLALNYRKGSQRVGFEEIVFDSDDDNDDNDSDDDYEDIREEADNMRTSDKVATSPMHVLIYGRYAHNAQSYSVVEPKVQSTNVFISDASSDLDLENLKIVSQGKSVLNDSYFSSLRSMRPNGTVVISQPKEDDEDERGSPIRRDLDGYEIIPGLTDQFFYVHCQPHVLASQEHGIMAAFLLPTIMDSITLQTERENNIEVDGQLLSGLRLVNLSTDKGKIRLKNVCSKDIRISTREGNVELEGLLDGHLMVDIRGTGDLVAKHIDGPATVARADLGDITVLGECSSVMSHFAVNAGNVCLRNVNGNTYILVHRVGFVTLNLVNGAATAIVNQGGAFCSFETLKSDSKVQVGDGDITVTIPTNHNFRIDVSARNILLEPKLMNFGDVQVTEDGQLERFMCGCHEGNNDLSVPVLTLEAPNGKVNVQYSDSRSDRKFQNESDL